MTIFFCEHLWMVAARGYTSVIANQSADWCGNPFPQVSSTTIRKLRNGIMKFSSSLKLNHIFRRLYRTNGYADGYMVLYARRNRTDTNRVGITVGKKLGKAHIRNRARRRLREVYRLNEEKFTPGWDIVIVARSKSVEAEFAKLTKSFLTLARKAGLLASVQEEA